MTRQEKSEALKNFLSPYFIPSNGIRRMNDLVIELYNDFKNDEFNVFSQMFYLSYLIKL